MRAERDAGVVRCIGRVVCGAGCGVGIAFVVSVLAPRPETAHAAADAAPAEPSGRAARDASAVEDTPEALWADPGAVRAAATRRAAVENATALESVPWRRLAPSDAPAPARGAPLRVPAPSAVASTPLGSHAGTPDAGPSMSQFAVLAAALLVVRWISQCLRTGTLSWRSVLVVSGFERPG